jgi:threonine aldolase
MRQAGILAACGIVSLTKMVDRLADDHDRARQLAAALQQLAGLDVQPEQVQTNMVLVQTQRPAIEWQQALQQRGLLCFPVAEMRLRLVLHADIDDSMVSRAIETFHEVAEALS